MQRLLQKLWLAGYKPVARRMWKTSEAVSGSMKRTALGNWQQGLAKEMTWLSIDVRICPRHGPDICSNVLTEEGGLAALEGVSEAVRSSDPEAYGFPCSLSASLRSWLGTRSPEPSHKAATHPHTSKIHQTLYTELAPTTEQI